MTIIKKEAVFKWTHPSPQGYTPRLSIERVGKNSYLPVSCWEGFECNFYRCCLRIWLLISLHLGADCGVPFGTPTGLGTPSTTGMANHSGLRGNQEFRSGWLMRFVSYMRPDCQDWQRWLFYLMWRNKFRGSRRIKKQGNMFQTKEKVNLQKPILMKQR